MVGRHNRQHGVSPAPADLLLSSLGAQARHAVHRGSSEPALSKHSSENGALCPGKATKLMQGHVLPLLPFPAAPGKLLGWEMGGRKRCSPPKVNSLA